MGESNIGWDDSARHGRKVTLVGAAGRAGVCTFCNLSLKISASSVSAEMLSSPT
jgi:hypothetical protein